MAFHSTRLASSRRAGARARVALSCLAWAPLVAFGSAARGADVHLELVAFSKGANEGESYPIEVRLVGPEDCKEIKAELPLRLDLRVDAFGGSAPDIEAILVEGKPTDELPLRFTLRGQSMLLEVQTLDDALVESDEVVTIEVSPAPPDGQILPTVECVAGGGKEDTLELVTKVAVLSFTIRDNDVPASGDETETPIATEETEPVSPRVALGDAGRKGVLFSARDELGPGTFVQLFDKAGEPRTGVIRVGSLGAADAGRHALAVLPGGRFFVVRATRSSASAATAESAATAGQAFANGSVVGRFFSPEGVPQADVVLAEGVEGGGVPAVEADGSGNVAVTWQQEGGGRGRVLGPAGQPKGGELDLGAGSAPVVGGSASGEFVAAWQAPGEGIFAQRFNEDGEPEGGPFVVSSSALAFDPDIAARDDGAFVVVWTDETQLGSDIFGRRFSPAGVAQGGSFVVNQNRTGNQSSPRVDANAAGDFAVVWESDLPPAASAASVQGNSVVGRFFTLDGAAAGGDEPVATANGGSTPAAPDVAVDDDDEVTVVVERRGPGGQTEGIFERVLQPSLATGVCTPDQHTMCLSGDRFRVTATWQNEALEGGAARVRSLTDDTGTLWFFEESNLEVVIKVLNGCTLNDRYWVFGAGLTDVEVNIVVDDVVSGKSRSYFKQLGEEFLPVVDLDAFASCDAAAGAEPLAATAALGVEVDEAWASWIEDLAAVAPSRWDPAAASAPLQLAGGRFRVEVAWSTAGGQAGAGEGVGLSGDTGYFWFFHPNNVEMLIKVLDGCALNGHYWVFAGGLTDVGAVVTVTDTLSGVSQIYENPIGQPFRPVRDTEAFGGCS